MWEEDRDTDRERGGSGGLNLAWASCQKMKHVPVLLLHMASVLLQKAAQQSSVAGRVSMHLRTAHSCCYWQPGRAGLGWADRSSTSTEQQEQAAHVVLPVDHLYTLYCWFPPLTWEELSLEQRTHKGKLVTVLFSYGCCMNCYWAAELSLPLSFLACRLRD